MGFFGVVLGNNHMKIRLNEVDGRCVWVADGFEPVYRAIDMADSGSLEGETNWQHGRTVFLNAPNGQTIAAKGVGWTHNWASGWCPEMGSFGILPLRAALHERDISLYLAEHDIACAKPLAIFQKFEIMAKSGDLINAEAVPDLDGTRAKPCVYYYHTDSILRCSELGMHSSGSEALLDNVLSGLGCNNVEEYLQYLSIKMASSSAFFHTHDGHNYSASSHNMTILGEILDFEYAVVENRHWKKELCEQQDIWRDKELDGWVMLLAEIMDTLRYSGDRRKIASDFVRTYLELGGDENLAICKMLL